MKATTTFLLSIIMIASCLSSTSQVTISGNIINPVDDTVSFRTRNNTFYAEVNEKGDFNITFSLDSATYINFHHGSERTSMYLKGNEKIELTINITEFDETIKYKGSDESSFLAEKYLENEAFSFYKKLSTENEETFLENLENYKTSILIKLEAINNDDFIKIEQKKVEKTVASLSKRKKLIDKVPKPGQKAIDFTYADINGDSVSLSDFKGKLVYVDVWATWCRPCRAELPALNLLEKDYHDKDIIFISVSVDKDKDAWIKMVKNKKLGGVQLWAGTGSRISENYAIFGIPRFMLFNKEGNVITTDAPRPSFKSIIDENGETITEDSNKTIREIIDLHL